MTWENLYCSEGFFNRAEINIVVYSMKYMMKKSPLIWILISYYGLLQLVHFVMNLIVIFISPELLSQASPLLTASQAHYFLFTSLVDFIFASPIGIMGAIFFLSKQKKVGIWMVSFSLIIAWLTAIAYVVLLLALHAFTLNATNIVFWLLFVPVAVLTVVLWHGRNVKQ